eukprot:2907278-Amphidinium_carterae.3
MILDRGCIHVGSIGSKRRFAAARMLPSGELNLHMDDPALGRWSAAAYLGSTVGIDFIPDSVHKQVHSELPASFIQDLVEDLSKLEVPKGSAHLSLARLAASRASRVAQVVLESRPRDMLLARCCCCCCCGAASFFVLSQSGPTMPLRRTVSSSYPHFSCEDGRQRELQFPIWLPGDSISALVATMKLQAKRMMLRVAHEIALLRAKHLMDLWMPQFVRAARCRAVWATNCQG